MFDIVNKLPLDEKKKKASLFGRQLQASNNYVFFSFNCFDCNVCQSYLYIYIYTYIYTHTYINICNDTSTLRPNKNNLKYSKTCIFCCTDKFCPDSKAQPPWPPKILIKGRVRRGRCRRRAQLRDNTQHQRGNKVSTRSISVLNMMGKLRFSVFGGKCVFRQF